MLFRSRAIERTGEPVPNHEYLTGDQIQRLHNAIYPKGQRLKYDAEGNIVGDERQPKQHAKGGNVDRMRDQLMIKGLAEGGQWTFKPGIKKVPEFYSPIDQALNTIRQPKGTRDQYLSMLRKTPGVREQEIADRNLKAMPEKLTKDQLQDFLNRNPAPKIEKTHLGIDAAVEKVLEDEYNKYSEDPEYQKDLDFIRRDIWSERNKKEVREKILSDPNNYAAMTQFDIYSLPGGSNHRSGRAHV